MRIRVGENWVKWVAGAILVIFWGSIVLFVRKSSVFKGSEKTATKGEEAKVYTPPPLPQYGPLEVAIVFAGGSGARGFSYTGVVEILKEAGIWPDIILGSGSAAILAAGYANFWGKDHAERIKMTEVYKIKNIFNVNFEELHWGWAASRIVEKMVANSLGVRTFEELPIPLVAVGTNISFGKTTVFGAGPLVPALMAAMAMPGYFAPYKIGGQYFLSGDIFQPAPVELARELGAKYIIVVTAPPSFSTTSPTNIFSIASRSIIINHRNLLEQQIKKADVIIEINFPPEVGLLEPVEEFELFYEKGRQAARKMLPEIQQQLAELRRKEERKAVAKRN